MNEIQETNLRLQRSSRHPSDWDPTAHHFPPIPSDHHRSDQVVSHWGRRWGSEMLPRRSSSALSWTSPDQPARPSTHEVSHRTEVGFHEMPQSEGKAVRCQTSWLVLCYRQLQYIEACLDIPVLEHEEINSQICRILDQCSLFGWMIWYLALFKHSKSIFYIKYEYSANIRIYFNYFSKYSVFSVKISIIND